MTLNRPIQEIAATFSMGSQPQSAKSQKRAATFPGNSPTEPPAQPYNQRSKHMQMTDLFARMGGLKSMARELGASESQAASGAEALIPAILGGFKKQAQSQPTGLEGLGGRLGQLGGGSLLDNVLSPQATDVNHGNDVLGQILGSKDVSRSVAQNAASRSGLAPSLLHKMRPMLAMLVAGCMTKPPADAAPPPAQTGGGLGGLLGGLLGDQAATPASPGAAAPGGLASILDLNGDGNALDDILRMAGTMMR